MKSKFLLMLPMLSFLAVTGYFTDKYFFDGRYTGRLYQSYKSRFNPTLIPIAPANWLDAALDKTEPAPCNQPTDVGSMFYKFKKIILNYRHFPIIWSMQEGGYPDALRFEAFNERILSSIKKNFGDCLKGKEIVVIPPLNLRDGNSADIEADIAKSYDPNNLSILISLIHDPRDATQFNAGKFAILSWAFYRPGLSGPISMPETSNFFVLKMDDDIVLDEHIEDFSKKLKPRRNLSPPGIVINRNKQ